MKEVIKHIETEKRVYPIVFNLNVMEEIQDQYGSMDAWGNVVQGDGEPKIKDLKAGLMAMINEAIDIENEEQGKTEPFVSSKQIGRIMTEVGVDKIAEAIKEITIASTRTGDEEKNA